MLAHPKHLPWGSVPHRGIRPRSPLTQASRACFVPSMRFLTTSTVYSSSIGVGLFHPTATSRIPPFRGFPLHQAAPSRRWPLPSCRFTISAICLATNATKTVTPSGPCSLRKSVTLTQGVSLRQSPIPSWGSPPPGFNRLAVSVPSHRFRSWSSLQSRSSSSLQMTSSVLPTKRSVFLSREKPTRPRFAA